MFIFMCNDFSEPFDFFHLIDFRLLILCFPFMFSSRFFKKLLQYLVIVVHLFGVLLF